MKKTIKFMGKKLNLDINALVPLEYRETFKENIHKDYGIAIVSYTELLSYYQKLTEIASGEIEDQYINTELVIEYHEKIQEILPQIVYIMIDETERPATYKEFLKGFDKITIGLEEAQTLGEIFAENFMMMK